MNIWNFLSRFIIKKRWLIIFTLFISTVFMIQQGRHAKMSYSLAKLLPENHKVSQEHKKFLEQYGSQNIFIVGLEDSSLTNYKNIHALDSISSLIKSMSGVDQVMSLTTLPILLKDTIQKKIKSINWFSDTINSQAHLNKALGIFFKQRIYEDLLITEDKKITIILISLAESVIESANRDNLIFSIKKLFDQYSDKYQATSYYSGLPYIRTVDSIKVKKEISLFIVLALLVTSLILFIFFRSFQATISSMIVVVLGVCFSFGTISLFNYEISVLMALVPPLLIVIGIPNCIFLINKFHNEFKRTSSKEDALKIMIKKIGNITFLTNVTTASGFAAFIFTNSETLQQFGVIASVNILCIFLLSLFIIPVFLSFFPAPKKRHTQHLDKIWLKKFVNYLIFLVKNKRSLIYYTTAFLLLFSFFGVLNVKTTGNITDDLPKDQILYKDLKFLEDNFGGVMPMEILVNTRKKNGLFKSYNINKIDKLSSALASYPELSKPTSYIDLIKYSKQAFYNGDSSFYAVPNLQEQGTILSYLKNSAGKSIDALMMDSLKQEARISLRVADISTSKMDSLLSSLIPMINDIFDAQKYDVIITGSSIVFLNGTKYLISNLVLSLLLVIILIALFMAWMFNSFRMVIVSIIPNIIPLFFTAAIMGYFNIALKPSTILVFSIAFGISVDDTIHFLAKYRQELVLNKWNIRKSVFLALKETGVSMLYTSVVLFFGFFIFVASDYGGTIAVGLLVSITLMIAMLANLLLLPSLLLSLEKVINYDAFEKSV